MAGVSILTVLCAVGSTLALRPSDGATMVEVESMGCQFTKADYDLPPYNGATDGSGILREPADVEGFWQYLTTGKQQVSGAKTLILMNGPPGSGKTYSLKAPGGVLSHLGLSQETTLHIDPDEGRNFIDDFNNLRCGAYAKDGSKVVFTNPVSGEKYDCKAGADGAMLAAGDLDIMGLKGNRPTNFLNRLMVQMGKDAANFRSLLVTRGGQPVPFEDTFARQQGNDKIPKAVRDEILAGVPDQNFRNMDEYSFAKKFGTLDILKQKSIFKRVTETNYNAVYDSACLDGEFCSLLGSTDSPILLGAFATRIFVFVYSPLENIEAQAQERVCKEGRGVYNPAGTFAKFWQQEGDTVKLQPAMATDYIRNHQDGDRYIVVCNDSKRRAMKLIEVESLNAEVTFSAKCE